MTPESRSDTMDIVIENIPTIVFSLLYSPLHRYLAADIVRWCYTTQRIDIDQKVKTIVLTVGTLENLGCCGSCEEGDDPDTYHIAIARDQSHKDFMATLMHELVHMNQWVTGEWDGDGEDEAERKQYKWTKKYLKDNTHE